MTEQELPEQLYNPWINNGWHNWRCYRIQYFADRKWPRAPTDSKGRANFTLMVHDKFQVVFSNITRQPLVFKLPFVTWNTEAYCHVNLWRFNTDITMKGMLFHFSQNSTLFRRSPTCGKATTISNEERPTIRLCRTNQSFCVPIRTERWVITSWRMRWEGHVTRVGKMRNAFKILFGKPYSKRGY